MLLDRPAHLGSDTVDRDEVIGRSAHSVHLLHHVRKPTVSTLPLSQSLGLSAALN